MQENMDAASLQHAMILARFARDEIIKSIARNNLRLSFPFLLTRIAIILSIKLWQMQRPVEE